MPTGEARYIKKKVKTGTVDIHPTDNCLVVNYEVEAFILGDDGQPMIGDSKKCQKLIRFHSLNPSTNCAALAKDVIAKCKLIHPSKLNEVQHLLSYLQYRRQCVPAMLVKSTDTVVDVNPFEETSKSGEKANLLDLEDYIELLYDEVPDKIKGSHLILLLCKDASNLDELTKNESLASVLSRVLREDWKKSVDLAVNLVGIFEKFSEYSAFHKVVLQHKIGSLCIEIISQELKSGVVEVEPIKDDDKGKSFRSKLPVRRNVKSALITELPKKSQIPVVKSDRRHSMIEDQAKSIVPEPSNSRKRDQLLAVCFSLLLNISESERIEDKIRKRNVVALLAQSLGRKSIQLLSVVLRFLRKLSVYKENIDSIASLNVIDALPRILLLTTKENNDSIADDLLPLLHNLSFERQLCEQMIRVGFLPELVKLAEKYKSMATRRKYVLTLLYHFSMDDRVKSMFAYTDSVNVIIDMLVDARTGDDPILKALCVNLALNNKNSQTLCDHRVISAIMEKAFNEKDAVCVKIVRNIVSHSNTKPMFEIYASEMAKCVKLYTHSHQNFAHECIGFLANLSTTDVDFNALFKKFQLFPLIKRCFMEADYVHDDIRLELLMLLGTVAYDESMSECLFQNDILALLIKLIKDKQEDDEVVLQIIFVFYQVLQHPLTRDYVTKHTDAPLYFIDLLHDNSPNIRKLCAACLDIIKDFDDAWTERVKTEKFQWHNSHWLEMIRNQMLSSGNVERTDDETEDVLPKYDLFQQSLMFQSGSHLSLSVDASMEMMNIINSEESSQSISEYNSDADFDVEFPKKISTPFEERYDLHDDFDNLVLDESSKEL